MAIKQDGQRGRPIEWDKLFKTYKRKTDYWSRTYRKAPTDEIRSISSFKERVLVLREKYGMNSVQAVRMLSQQAGLGVSLRQINAYLESARSIGINADMRTALRLFQQGAVGDITDIETVMTDNFGDEWDEDDLRQAALTGLLSLTEVNHMLLRKFAYAKSAERSEWIGQNIFGSN